MMPDASYIIHDAVEDQKAYDYWALDLRMEEIVEYARLAEDIDGITLEKIPRKERNLFLYEIFRHLNFKLQYLELGSSLFEVIDGLAFTRTLLHEQPTLTDISYIGVEISDLLRRSALVLHRDYDIQYVEDATSIEYVDVLYDRAVSSYCFRDARDLAEVMNRARICFPNLHLSRTMTFDEVNSVGKAMTYFSLPALIRYLQKPLYYLFGRVSEQKVEAFFICCTEEDLQPILDGFQRNVWLRRFIETKDFEVCNADRFVVHQTEDTDLLANQCFRSEHHVRYQEYLAALST